MKLVGLQSLCWLCHGAKHIACFKRKGILPQVKEQLQKVYGMKDEELDRIESDAKKIAIKLNTSISRERDLTYLNHERFADVHQIMGRQFSMNELHNCRVKSFNSSRQPAQQTVVDQDDFLLYARVIDDHV
jgi:hypothetical protein